MLSKRTVNLHAVMNGEEVGVIEAISNTPAVGSMIVIGKDGDIQRYKIMDITWYYSQSPSQSDPDIVECQVIKA